MTAWSEVAQKAQQTARDFKGRPAAPIGQSGTATVYGWKVLTAGNREEDALGDSATQTNVTVYLGNDGELYAVVKGTESAGLGMFPGTGRRSHDTTNLVTVDRSFRLGRRNGSESAGYLLRELDRLAQHTA